MIPESAVEAAARVLLELATPGFPWTDLVPDAQARFLMAARVSLEAAAPHMVKMALNDALDDLEDIDPDNLRVWLRERADDMRPTP